MPHDPHLDDAKDTRVPTPRTPAQEDPRHSQNRNRRMELMPEAMARSHMSERLRQAESQRLATALLLERRSRRLQRRAARASHRARRALARAVM
ncbi:hypothetical protein HCN52_24235 [Streptomyces bohaiensis]|uniref:Uncharacterized protein n=2 Tax=Streptomyces bohaiensis TaxID=1431344 RepID=A0ABX1CJ73_9ACTN|nr:hypothetical protein [Streptomyces bohaiensis]NJQ17950.1 hypothetical protein [Streptomyces bohaiensis]